MASQFVNSEIDLQVFESNEEFGKTIMQMIDDLNLECQEENEKSGSIQGDMELNDTEKKFLFLVDRGDITSVKYMIDNENGKTFNMTCVDSLGRNALHIAVDNEHTEMLQMLLSYNFEIGDSLLHAISKEHSQSVQIILTVLSSRPKKKDLSGLLGNQSSTFTSDITPLIMAAHRDNYSIIKTLLNCGEKIPKPHNLRCSCNDCIFSQREDSLRHSLSRINAYKALASPSLICLSSMDPILTAFELAYELKQLVRMGNEFKEEYEKLVEQCQEFATEILTQTRCSKELETILNYNHSQLDSSYVADKMASFAEDKGNMEEKMTLSRLKLAIDYKQKSFVAHPHCQQLLTTLWYEGVPGIRKLPMHKQIAIVGMICISFPVLSFLYAVAPKSRYGCQLKKPFIKFLCHIGSRLFFILLIAITSTKIEERIFNTLEIRLLDRGPPPTIGEWGIIIYLTGYVWQAMKLLYSRSIATFLADMWNILDFATNSVYMTAFLLRLAAYIIVQRNDANLMTERFVSRDQWESFEPVFVSECLFAFANICCVLKLIFLFILHPRLGPLQISLGRMLGDILKFFCIFFLVLTAYTLGMVQLFRFYGEVRDNACHNRTFPWEFKKYDVLMWEYCKTQGKYYNNLFETAQALYWTAFDQNELTNLNVEYQHYFTEFVGKLMMGSYIFIALIMLLNMFIAMMTHSYEKTSEDGDLEWKFARAKLLLTYFEEGGTIPVPFNILPSVKSVFYFWIRLKRCLTGYIEKDSFGKLDTLRYIICKINEKDVNYRTLMRDLTMRYIINRQRSEETKGITEDDLNELKTDINSFRYDLFEMLKLNGMKIPSYMQRQYNGKLRRKISKRGFFKLITSSQFLTSLKSTNGDDLTIKDTKDMVYTPQQQRRFSRQNIKMHSLRGITETFEDTTEVNIRTNKQLLDASNLLVSFRRTRKVSVSSIENSEAKISKNERPESADNITNAERSSNQRSDMV